MSGTLLEYIDYFKLIKKHHRNRYAFRSDLKEWRKGFAYISRRETGKIETRSVGE